jgi:hypothetical protein
MVWESPGPRSPSAPVLHNVAVKEEINDVQGMLDAWEDFDSSVAGAKVVEVIAQAAAHALESESTSKVKMESLDSWSWDSSQSTPNDDWYAASDGEIATRIKQEDLDIDMLPYPETLTSDLCSTRNLASSSLNTLSMNSSSPPTNSQDQWHDDNPKHPARPRSPSRAVPPSCPPILRSP